MISPRFTPTKRVNPLGRHLRSFRERGGLHPFATRLEHDSFLFTQDLKTPRQSLAALGEGVGFGGDVVRIDRDRVAMVEFVRLAVGDHAPGDLEGPGPKVLAVEFSRLAERGPDPEPGFLANLIGLGAAQSRGEKGE